MLTLWLHNLLPFRHSTTSQSQKTFASTNIAFCESYTQTESLCSQSIAIMLQCSTCPLGTYSKLRLAPATLPTTTQDVVLLKTTCSHSKKHYHHQSYNQRTTRPLPAKSFTPYNHVLSHKTPNPSVLHLSIVISLKYHTQSIPICTQSQSQRVDAYCSTLRLCMVLHVKIAWLSLCSPPPYGVKEEEESVRVVTDSQRQLSLTSTSDDIRRLISRMNAVKVQKIA